MATTMEDDSTAVIKTKDAGRSMIKPKPVAGHPKFIEMAKDAIITLDEKKGSSVQAIGTYIVEKYKLDPEKVKQHLKPALARGLEQGVLVRPKGSDAKGYTGRFKVEKGKLSEENKEKKEKEKKKMTKAEGDTGKKKKNEKKTAVEKADTKPKKTPIKSSKKAAKSPKKASKSPKKVTKPKTEGTVRKKATKLTPKSRTKLTQVKATPSKAKKKTLAK